MCTAKSVVKANNKDLMKCDLIVYNVPGAGIEPALTFGESDFKSDVSTNSTTRAFLLLVKEPP